MQTHLSMPPLVCVVGRHQRRDETKLSDGLNYKSIGAFHFRFRGRVHLWPLLGLVLVFDRRPCHLEFKGTRLESDSQMCSATSHPCPFARAAFDPERHRAELLLACCKSCFPLVCCVGPGRKTEEQITGRPPNRRTSASSSPATRGQVEILRRYQLTRARARNRQEVPARSQAGQGEQ